MLALDPAASRLPTNDAAAGRRELRHRASPMHVGRYAEADETTSRALDPVRGTGTRGGEATHNWSSWPDPDIRRRHSPRLELLPAQRSDIYG